ncbi:MAG: LruC domain-containing protein [Bacteroidales bacterium]|nr:LruC domain-containing protein [Bacteroidales bacterium]MCF8455541.1 LruC domain-containing protein [Bacteroidales bacterium]
MKIGNTIRLKIAVMGLLWIGLSGSIIAQSFILALQNNAMSFKESNRTVIYDPGNNGGESEGAIHKYSNVVTVSGVTVYALLTIEDINNAFIDMFDDDSQTGEINRFQPRIGSNWGGGFIVYQLEFFDAADDESVFLYDYYMTGIDIDGNGSSNREYVEVGGYASYQVNSNCGLTISTNQVSGRTKFLGISNSLNGVTFDNTASFIANFSTPNNIITFALGQTAQNSSRYYSVQFGAPGGIFTNPVTVQNPLPLAVDDVGVPVDGAVGGIAVANVLTNDSYNGNSVSLSTVDISLVTAASNPGVVLNLNTGEVTVAAGTPIGTYYIIYQICMVSAQTDCDVATVTVDVTGSTDIVNYFPAGGYGTLAFEDMWPAQGDYDFNDLVVDYQFEITSNQSNIVSKVEATFILKAFGATYSNGFGFQFDASINQSDLSVSGYSLSENYVTLASNGLEAGQTKPTFIVFDNAFSEMPHPGGGIGVNTVQTAPYVTPDTLRLTILFNTGSYTLNDLNISEFNPFLMVNLNRGIEVHLPNYAPTDKADSQLFGTGADDSNPSINRYYKTNSNLPWAINIYETFNYPIEKAAINNAHLKFNEWAGTNGVSYPNWYQNQTGYRSTSNIFVQP